MHAQLLLAFAMFSTCALQAEDVVAALDFFRAPPATIEIRLSENALASLQAEPRKDVQGALLINDLEFKDVRLHLMGGMGSFEPVDRKPSWTVKLPKSQALFLHGLAKFQLKNSEGTHGGGGFGAISRGGNASRQRGWLHGEQE